MQQMPEQVQNYNAPGQVAKALGQCPSFQQFIPSLSGVSGTHYDYVQQSSAY